MAEGAGPAVAEHDVSTMSAEELVAACRSGDVQAWEHLVDKYHNLVFAIAVGEGLSVEDAADLTQSTFEALLAQLDNIRDDARIASWLMTVARRQAWRVRNRRGRILALPDESTGTLDQLSTDDGSDEVVRLMWVYEGLSQLDDPCRHQRPSSTARASTPSRSAPIVVVSP